MERGRIPATDLNVSQLCYGTANLGSDLLGADADAVINAYRDAGGNFFDTAHVYAVWHERGPGCSERALADYFRRNGGRCDTVVATKGGHPSMRGYERADAYLGAEQIAADVDDSLERLDAETIDLYWLHRDDPRMAVGEIVEIVNAEIARGRIRHVAASNWTCERIEQANAHAVAHGLAGFVASQPSWSLAASEGRIGDGTMVHLDAAGARWHERTQLPVIPYNSTAGGAFATGKLPRKFDNEVTRGRLERARRLAERKGCTPNQIAVAYLLAQPFPVIPILGTKRVDHLRDAIGALEVGLSPAERDWLADGGAEPDA